MSARKTRASARTSPRQKRPRFNPHQFLRDVDDALGAALATVEFMVTALTKLGEQPSAVLLHHGVSVPLGLQRKCIGMVVKHLERAKKRMNK